MHDELTLWVQLFFTVNSEFFQGERIQVLRQDAGATDSDLVIFSMLHGMVKAFQTEQIKNGSGG